MITMPLPRNVGELQTPALLVDAALLAANLAHMAQALARRAPATPRQGP